MVHVEGIAEEDDYYSSSSSSSEIEDIMNQLSDDDADDIEDEDPLFELDSDGNPIYDEDGLIKGFIRQCNRIQSDMDYIDEFLESGPQEPLFVKEVMTDRFATLDSALLVAHIVVDMLVEGGLHGSKMETIHQMHNHAISKVSSIKAKIDELVLN